MQTQLQVYFLIGTALTALIVIVMTINTIYKIRVERAILRMDKNLQKFIEQQDGPSKKTTLLTEKNKASE